MEHAHDLRRLALRIVDEQVGKSLHRPAAKTRRKQLWPDPSKLRPLDDAPGGGNGRAGQTSSGCRVSIVGEPIDGSFDVPNRLGRKMLRPAHSPA